jgi:hypothetical protein
VNAEIGRIGIGQRTGVARAVDSVTRGISKETPQMTTERLEMRKIREILRLRWQDGLTVRQTARSVGRSVGGVLPPAPRVGTENLKHFCLASRWHGGHGSLAARLRSPHSDQPSN